MGKVLIQSYTTKNPISMIGEEAGICWGADTSDINKNYKNTNDLFNKIENLKNVADINIKDTLSQIGGGSLPAERIKSKSVTIMPKNISTQFLEAKLRAGKNPVVGRISEEKLILDMRTVLEDEIDILAQKLIDILK